MPLEVLRRRTLNRTLLERQLLLRRVPGPGESGPDRVLAALEHLAGLQAQAPFPPYYGLWSRLAGFQPAELANLLTGRLAVRIALMRGTLHLVSARDSLMIRPLVQPVLDRALKSSFGSQLAGVARRYPKDQPAGPAAGETITRIHAVGWPAGISLINIPRVP